MGTKLLVEFIEWPDKTDSPLEKIKNVLGKPGEHKY